MKAIVWVTLSLSVLFLLFVVHFVRKRRLREQYAILWLMFAAVMIALSSSYSWLDEIAPKLGVAYAPSLLFLVGIIICLTLILHLTVVVSSLSIRVVRLTQEIAMLRSGQVGEGEEASGVSGDGAERRLVSSGANALENRA